MSVAFSSRLIVARKGPPWQSAPWSCRAERLACVVPPTFGERVIAQPAEASYAYVVGSRDAPGPRYVYEYEGIRDAAYCHQRFRSYDLASGTYMGYDGMRHSCP